MTRNLPREAKPRKQTRQQILLGVHLRELGFTPTPEYQFYDKRAWRFDWAQPSERIAWEVDGGKWTGGHRRGSMIDDENDKTNTAQMLGWKVMRFANDFVWDGRARAFIHDWLR